MPDEIEKEATDAAAPSKKSGLVADWKKLATWQKAGVLIGGAALVVAVLMFINREPTPVATGNAGALAPMNEGMPGAGDQFPPLPVPPIPASAPAASPPPKQAPKQAPIIRTPIGHAPARRTAPAPKTPVRRILPQQPPVRRILPAPRGRL